MDYQPVKQVTKHRGELPRLLGFRPLILNALDEHGDIFVELVEIKRHKEAKYFDAFKLDL